MNSYYQSLLYLLLSITMLCLFACNRNTSKSVNYSTNSSSIQAEPATPVSYTGYRLELINITVNEEKGNFLQVNGTIINTGRNKVVLPSKHANEIVINFDEAFLTSNYDFLSDAIKSRLLKQKINLEPGQMAYNTSLGVKKVMNTTSNTIPQKEVITQKESALPATEPIIEKEVISEEEFVEKGSKILGEEACPDLVIESFSVTKRKKKYAEITYTIVNKGNAPASLFGEEKSVDDNIAVRAYASGTAKLSRGDMILGGSFIEKGLKDKGGILNPNESYEGTFRIDIRKKTRHMPYLIMFVDTYQGIWECNEGNNVMNITYR